MNEVQAFLEILKARRIRHGIFLGLIFCPGIFGGFDFYPHSIIPVWSPEIRRPLTFHATHMGFLIKFNTSIEDPKIKQLAVISPSKLQFYLKCDLVNLLSLS